VPVPVRGIGLHKCPPDSFSWLQEPDRNAQEDFGAFEKVLVELEWYDGMRAGIANVEGVPHYFRTEDYIHPADEVTFLTWKVDEEGLRWEIESWQIFVAWNDQYEAGEATADSHPGRGGLNARYDELERLLEVHRKPPEGAVRRRARWRRGTGFPARYAWTGPSTEVRWRRSY
jgi:hypothetical protein